MERCWHGKFSGTGRCPEPGRYGNPEGCGSNGDPKLKATLKFMQAARWCAAHRQPYDRLLEPEDGAAASGEGARPPD